MTNVATGLLVSSQILWGRRSQTMHVLQSFTIHVRPCVMEPRSASIRSRCQTGIRQIHHSNEFAAAFPSRFVTPIVQPFIDTPYCMPAVCSTLVGYTSITRGVSRPICMSSVYVFCCRLQTALQLQHRPSLRLHSLTNMLLYKTAGKRQ